MLAKFPLAETPQLSTAQAVSRLSVETTAVPSPAPNGSELVHLARAVLLKSPDDLAAIAQIAPAMPANWMEAFAAERARAELEAKFWTSAIAYLMSTTPTSVTNDR